MLWHGKNFRGILTKAKEMIFDNTGTDLISTNAEDAIKEVNSNLSQITTHHNITVTFESGVSGIYTLTHVGKYLTGYVWINIPSGKTAINSSLLTFNNITPIGNTPKTFGFKRNSYSEVFQVGSAGVLKVDNNYALSGAGEFFIPIDFPANYVE